MYAYPPASDTLREQQYYMKDPIGARSSQFHENSAMVAGNRAFTFSILDPICHAKADATSRAQDSSSNSNMGAERSAVTFPTSVYAKPTPQLELSIARSPTVFGSESLSKGLSESFERDERKIERHVTSAVRNNKNTVNDAKLRNRRGRDCRSAPIETSGQLLDHEDSLEAPVKAPVSQRKLAADLASPLKLNASLLATNPLTGIPPISPMKSPQSYWAAPPCAERTPTTSSNGLLVIERRDHVSQWTRPRPITDRQKEQTPDQQRSQDSMDPPDRDPELASRKRVQSFSNHPMQAPPKKRYFQKHDNDEHQKLREYHTRESKSSEHLPGGQDLFPMKSRSADGVILSHEGAPEKGPEAEILNDFKQLQSKQLERHHLAAMREAMPIPFSTAGVNPRANTLHYKSALEGSMAAIGPQFTGTQSVGFLVNRGHPTQSSVAAISESDERTRLEMSARQRQLQMDPFGQLGGGGHFYQGSASPNVMPGNRLLDGGAFGAVNQGGGRIPPFAPLMDNAALAQKERAELMKQHLQQAPRYPNPNAGRPQSIDGGGRHGPPSPPPSTTAACINGSAFSTTTPNNVIEEIKNLPQGDTLHVALNTWEWYAIDGVKLPCVFRKNERFLAVHIVQMRLLAKFPPNVPTELTRRYKMVSHKMTVLEAWTFNTLNCIQCHFEYGYQLFSPADDVVKSTDVEKFYWAVKTYNFRRMLEVYRHEIRAASDLHLPLTAHISSLRGHAESELKSIRNMSDFNLGSSPPSSALVISEPEPKPSSFTGPTALHSHGNSSYAQAMRVPCTRDPVENQINGGGIVYPRSYHESQIRHRSLFPNMARYPEPVSMSQTGPNLQSRYLGAPPYFNGAAAQGPNANEAFYGHSAPMTPFGLRLSSAFAGAAAAMAQPGRFYPTQPAHLALPHSLVRPSAAQANGSAQPAVPR